MWELDPLLSFSGPFLGHTLYRSELGGLNRRGRTPDVSHIVCIVPLVDQTATLARFSYINTHFHSAPFLPSHFTVKNTKCSSFPCFFGLFVFFAAVIPIILIAI